MTKPDTVDSKTPKCNICFCYHGRGEKHYTDRRVGTDTVDKATAVQLPITSTRIQGLYHEIKDSSGRIILLADVLPEHVETIVRAVNAYSPARDTAFKELVEAGQKALESLEVLARVDANNTGIDVAICEYKGTKELRAALKAVEELK